MVSISSNTARFSLKSGLLFGLLFVGIWSIVTLGFDAFVITSIARSISARSRFQPAQAVITRSEVATHTGSKGATYSASIEYVYSVNGSAHTSSRYVFGDISTSSHSHAHAIVAAHPVGSNVTAYYDPADPDSAVLSTDVQGVHLFMIIFLMPFNIIMVCGFYYLLTSLRGAPDPVATRVVADDGIRAVFRPSKFSPAMAALVAALATSFVSIFAVGIVSGADPTFRMIVIDFVVIGVATALAAAARHARIRSGRCDIAIDRGLKTITLPRSRQNPLPAAIPFSQIASVDAPLDPNRRKNNAATYKLCVSVRDPSMPEPVVLAKWMDRTTAEGCAGWLRKELRLGSV